MNLKNTIEELEDLKNNDEAFDFTLHIGRNEDKTQFRIIYSRFAIHNEVPQLENTKSIDYEDLTDIKDLKIFLKS